MPAIASSDDDTEERQLAATVYAYERAGGLMHADEVALRMRRHHDQPLSLLARWIVTRALVVVPWGRDTLVPMFQFDHTTMTPRAALAPVLHELTPVFDDLQLAHWFSAPNTALGGCMPMELLGDDAVLQAARADRFVAFDSWVSWIIRRQTSRIQVPL